MKRVLDHDPLTGMTTYFEQEESTGTIHISAEQDVAADLELCKAMANDDDYSKRGIKNEMWHYAHIPDVLLLEMHKRGVNPFTREGTKELFKLVNDPDYKKLKVTAGYHR